MALRSGPPHARSDGTVIGPQRISAGGDEIEHSGKGRLIDTGIGGRALHLCQQSGFVKRAGTGHSHDMLGQHVKAARAERLAIALPFVHRVHGCHGFQKFEAVARH